MATVISKIDTSSEEFAANVAAMEKHIDNLNQHIERIKEGGSVKAQEREHARGKLLVRERINLLIDDNTEFHELSIMAGFQLYEDNIPAGGLVTGIGYVEGIACMIIANDATVKRGLVLSHHGKETFKGATNCGEEPITLRLYCGLAALFYPNKTKSLLIRIILVESSLIKQECHRKVSRR